MFEDAISGQGRGAVSRRGCLAVAELRCTRGNANRTPLDRVGIYPGAPARQNPQHLTAQQDHIAGAEKPTILVLRWVLSEPSLVARLPIRLGSTHAESLPLE